LIPAGRVEPLGFQILRHRRSSGWRSAADRLLRVAAPDCDRFEAHATERIGEQAFAGLEALRRLQNSKVCSVAVRTSGSGSSRLSMPTCTDSARD